MKPEMEQALRVNAPFTTSVLEGFIRDEVRKVGFERVLFGLSGGIDSALSAYLATRALGKDAVHAVLMPYRTSSQSSLDDAMEVVEDLGIPYTVVDISGPVDAYFEKMDKLLGERASNLRRGNRMARERMVTLYDLSAANNSLVVGTSNKTELLLGYGTQFGDMASALNPIGDLYKSQVRQISRYVGVPSSILDKAPSADLWEDQTDEKELGFSYDDADEILFQWVDLRLSEEEIVERGYDAMLVRQIVRRVQRNHYKRRLPIIAKISSRTIGIDFRYSRDWGV
ncbi:NAD+ synthase [Alicyclobacillus acidoterrestris]|uniref:NH(3)-dependent NAD(+) synthetase n=1 Tax=Alicyclobacillus acidoterrestris (strain ATCC 49025 / DSM 3922 / CIP 106132 / NCIMB 13137 / GD3B) TaxID=1356854 RepID=T0BMY3_ALIAG|nr:NAD+ synthase [Alicyclobacillus acidoterrestris]EPZ42104.1 NAD synthetase [Alicyclobacillus acidoterrestris ATCC 49025]UNO48190.1 NAD+ synthase [Alicyclobacillus acidoterrestris]